LEDQVASFFRAEDGKKEGDGGKTFLWKVDTYLLNYTASYSRML
jgi:hypothetical protein